MSGFIDYILKNKIRNGLIAFTLFLLVPLLYVSYQKGEERYILNGEEVVGISGVERGVPIKVEAVRNQAREEREVMITARDTEDNVNHNKTTVDNEMIDQLVVGNSISQTVKELGDAESQGILYLPEEGSNGVRFKWKKPESPKVYLLPLPAIPLILLFMYRDSVDKEREKREREKAEILMTIPSFSDRLLLLLSCGLIYEDAFKRIAEGYRNQGEINAFGRLIIKASEEAEGTNRESISYLMEYAGELKIKELSRLVGIIADNRFRGGDLSQKLRQEGRLLWNERKKKAEELGRKAETKLSGPMALMLVVLIAVTAAPALIQI